MARETLSDVRAERDNALDRAKVAEHKLIRLMALLSVLREVLAEIDRVSNA